MSDDLEAIFAAMDAAYTDLENRAGDAVQWAGLNCEGKTKQRAPVKTGRLRSSYAYAKTAKLACTVGTNVEYAPSVELGHVTKSGSYVPAKPHFFPSAREAGNELVEDLKDLGV